MSWLWDLPPEIRRLIYLKFNLDDLKAFSTCSTTCFEEVHGLLDGYQIHISWHSLTKLDTSVLNQVTPSKKSLSFCSGSKFLSFQGGDSKKFLHFAPYLTSELSWCTVEDAGNHSALLTQKKVTTIEVRHFDPDFSFFDGCEDEDSSLNDYNYEDPNGTELMFRPGGYDPNRTVENFKNVFRLFNPDVVKSLQLRHLLIGTQNEVFRFACSLFPNLKELRLRRIRDEECQLVCGMTNLTILDLNSSELEDQCLIKICSSLPKLKSLNIASTFITNDGMRHIGKLRDLAELDMSDLGVDEIDGVSQLVSLRRLNMNFCGRLDMNASVSKLTKLKYLNELCMTKSYQVKEGSPYFDFIFGDYGVPELSLLISLRKIDVIGCNLTDEGLVMLATCLKNLQELDISDTQVEDLSPLQKLLSLKKLSISYLPVTNKGIMKLKELPLLNDLKMSSTLVFQLSPPPLNEFQTLTSLTCRSNDLYDEDVFELCRISGLKEIDVSFNDNITDTSLEHLGQVSTLESVGVADTNITNDGLDHLSSLHLLDLDLSQNLQLTDDCMVHIRQLKVLKIFRCWKTKVNKSTIIQFHNERPWIQINRNIVQDHLY